MRSTRRGRDRSRLATSKPVNVMFSNGLGVCKSGNAGIKSICLKKATGSKNTKSTVAPTPSPVTILSITAQSDNIDTSKAGVGKVITFTVTFSDNITITYGTAPAGLVELPFKIGASDYFASCTTVSGNTSDIHFFTYTVLDGDAELLAAENVTLTAGDLLILSNTTVEDANGNNFTGGITALTSATLEVDTLVPQISTTGGAQTSGTTNIVFTFNAGPGNSNPRAITQGTIDKNNFSVDLSTSIDTVIQTASLTGPSGSPANTVLLVLSNPNGTPIVTGEQISVTFAKPTTGGSTFADEYGNQVISFANQSVNNNV